MDRLMSRHALRHLDTDLIDRLLSSGPQRDAKPAPKKSARVPRPASSYRQNSSRTGFDHWVRPVKVFERPFRGSIPLNRSARWKRADSYLAARELSPSQEPVR